MRCVLPPALEPARRLSCIVFFMLLMTVFSAGAQDRAADSPVATHSDAECEVWARELGFAASVAAHDAASFAGHVDPGAAFNTGQAVPLRGRQAVVDAWADLIAGRGLRLSWYPTRVTIAAVPDIAWSSGPALYEITDADADADASPRYRIGGFHSVWHRGADGVWRVVYDDGIPTRPANPEEVAAFHAGRRESCPRA